MLVPVKSQFCFVAGYSVSVGEKNNGVLYFAGAPRWEHRGQVIVFRHDGMSWTVAQKISGNQVSPLRCTQCRIELTPQCAAEIPLFDVLLAFKIFLLRSKLQFTNMFTFTLQDFATTI